MPGFASTHQVSSEGRLRKGERILRPTLKDGRYLIIGLRRNGKHYLRYVHRLVAEAFLGKIPAGKEINHRDGNKRNNHWRNLERVTHLENMQHASKNGLLTGPRGERCRSAILTAKIVVRMRQLRRRGWTARRLGERFGVSGSAAYFAVSGRSWKHI